MADFQLDNFRIEDYLPKFVREGKRLGLRGDDDTIYHFAQEYANLHNGRSITTGCSSAGALKLVFAALRACVRELKGKTLASLKTEARAGDAYSMVILSDVYMFGLLGCERNALLANKWSHKACTTGDPFACANEATKIMKGIDTDPSFTQYWDKLVRLCEECARSNYICPTVLRTGISPRNVFQATDFPALAQVAVERHHEISIWQQQKANDANTVPVSGSLPNPLQCSYSECAKVVENESQLQKCGACRQARYCKKGTQTSRIVCLLVLRAVSE